MILTKLSDDQIKEKLDELQGWQLVNGKLYRVPVLKDFNQRFGFITRDAIYA